MFTFKLLKYQGQTSWQMTQQMLIPILYSPFQPRIFTGIDGLRVLEQFNTLSLSVRYELLL